MAELNSSKINGDLNITGEITQNGKPISETFATKLSITIGDKTITDDNITTLGTRSLMMSMMSKANSDLAPGEVYSPKKKLVPIEEFEPKLEIVKKVDERNPDRVNYHVRITNMDELANFHPKTTRVIFLMANEDYVNSPKIISSGELSLNPRFFDNKMLYSDRISFFKRRPNQYLLDDNMIASYIRLRDDNHEKKNLKIIRIGKGSNPSHATNLFPRAHMIFIKSSVVYGIILFDELGYIRYSKPSKNSFYLKNSDTGEIAVKNIDKNVFNYNFEKRIKNKRIFLHRSRLFGIVPEIDYQLDETTETFKAFITNLDKIAELSGVNKEDLEVVVGRNNGEKSKLTFYNSYYRNDYTNTKKVPFNGNSDFLSLDYNTGEIINFDKLYSRISKRILKSDHSVGTVFYDYLFPFLYVKNTREYSELPFYSLRVVLTNYCKDNYADYKLGILKKTKNAISGREERISNNDFNHNSILYGIKNFKNLYC